MALITFENDGSYTIRYPDRFQLVKQVDFFRSELDEQAGQVQTVVPDRIQALGALAHVARRPGQHERGRRRRVKEEVVVGQDEQGNTEPGEQEVDGLGSDRHRGCCLFSFRSPQS